MGPKGPVGICNGCVRKEHRYAADFKTAQVGVGREIGSGYVDCRTWNDRAVGVDLQTSCPGPFLDDDLLFAAVAAAVIANLEDHALGARQVPGCGEARVVAGQDGSPDRTPDVAGGNIPAEGRVARNVLAHLDPVRETIEAVDARRRRGLFVDDDLLFAAVATAVVANLEDHALGARQVPGCGEARVVAGQDGSPDRTPDVASGNIPAEGRVARNVLAHLDPVRETIEAVDARRRRGLFVDDDLLFAAVATAVVANLEDHALGARQVPGCGEARVVAGQDGSPDRTPDVAGGNIPAEGRVARNVLAHLDPVREAIEAVDARRRRGRFVYGDVLLARVTSAIVADFEDDHFAARRVPLRGEVPALAEPRSTVERAPEVFLGAAAAEVRAAGDGLGDLDPVREAAEAVDAGRWRGRFVYGDVLLARVTSAVVADFEDDHFAARRVPLRGEVPALAEPRSTVERAPEVFLGAAAAEVRAAGDGLGDLDPVREAAEAVDAGRWRGRFVYGDVLLARVTSAVVADFEDDHFAARRVPLRGEVPALAEPRSTVERAPEVFLGAAAAEVRAAGDGLGDLDPVREAAEAVDAGRWRGSLDIDRDDAYTPALLIIPPPFRTCRLPPAIFVTVPAHPIAIIDPKLSGLIGGNP